MKRKEIFNLPEYDPDFIDWDPMLVFTKEEAFQLLNHEVLKNSDGAHIKNPPLEKIGLVVGILTMNDEVEVLVKFREGMDQLCKAELCGDYIVLPD